jgi:hypothetical protein
MRQHAAITERLTQEVTNNMQKRKLHHHHPSSRGTTLHLLHLLQCPHSQTIMVDSCGYGMEDTFLVFFPIIKNGLWNTSTRHAVFWFFCCVFTLSILDWMKLFGAQLQLLPIGYWPTVRRENQRKSNGQRFEKSIVFKQFI